MIQDVVLASLFLLLVTRLIAVVNFLTKQLKEGLIVTTV